MNKSNKLLTIILPFIMIGLAACNTQEEQESHGTHESDGVKMLEVDLTLPSKAAIDEEVKAIAHVTMDDENIEDADEVIFEYWKDDDKDNSTKVEAKHHKNGQYIFEFIPSEAGTYHVISHVTARDMHTMPEKSIEVK